VLEYKALQLFGIIWKNNAIKYLSLPSSDLECLQLAISLFSRRDPLGVRSMVQEVISVVVFSGGCIAVIGLTVAFMAFHDWMCGRKVFGLEDGE
jgi:hypothetical protein